MRVPLLSLLLLSGCAGTMTGGAAAREYTGRPYSVRLNGGPASPGAPSGGFVGSGGMLTGVVCGVSIDYQVEHKGQFLEAVGQLNNDSALGSMLRMAGDDEVRVIKGSLGSRAISLTFTADSVKGFVGRRSVDFAREGERMVYAFQVSNVRAAQIHHVLQGFDEFWRLPPAVQTVTLPLALACLYARFEDASMPLDDPPPIVFGGPGGQVPAGTLVFR